MEYKMCQLVLTPNCRNALSFQNSIICVFNYFRIYPYKRDTKKKAPEIDDILMATRQDKLCITSLGGALFH